MSSLQSDADVFALFAAHGFVTASSAMLPVLRLARKAALVSDVTVLLEGETGTGKQVLAQAIHNLDEKRKGRRFITVHCSTIAETLAESELFGHHRGAFSGAARDRDGLFLAADGGTLLLDDVNDLPLGLQPKLLDVLQRGVVRGLGSDCETKVNVRIIGAANQPLAAAVRQNRFRGDLYHRLNVVRLHLPPLRERADDVAALALAFAHKHQNVYPAITCIDPDLIEFMKTCPFPGNVRELEHAVERMLFIKTEGETLQVSDWMAQCSETYESGNGSDLVTQAAQCLWKAICREGLPYSEVMRRLERQLLQTALDTQAATRRELASRLRTSERTLYHKLRVHNLTRSATVD
jgi:transcriptional regulator with GAF, ATPase, and Fis domain